MQDCVFCKIVRGEIPSYKIYEDEKYLAFLDISQVNDGHTLLIPKQHVRWVWDIEEIGEFFKVARKIAKHMQQVTGKEFVYSQTIGLLVEHAHLHLVPETEGNLNLALEGWSKAREARKLSKEEMERIWEKYRMS